MSCNKGNLVDSVARVKTGVYTHQQIKKSIECKKVNRSPLFCAHPRQGVFNWMIDIVFETMKIGSPRASPL